MNKLTLGLFIIGYLLSFSYSQVLEYTDANFDSEITQYDIALAEFYAPW